MKLAQPTGLRATGCRVMIVGRAEQREPRRMCLEISCAALLLPGYGYLAQFVGRAEQREPRRMRPEISCAAQIATLSAPYSALQRSHLYLERFTKKEWRYMPTTLPSQQDLVFVQTSFVEHMLGCKLRKMKVGAACNLRKYSDLQIDMHNRNPQAEIDNPPCRGENRKRLTLTIRMLTRLPPTICELYPDWST
jgi:hypothetical protein